MVTCAFLMIGFFCVSGSSCSLFSQKELAPIEDQSMVMFVIQSPPDSSLAYNVGQMNPVVESLQEIDGGLKIWQIIFNTGGFGGLELENPADRDFSA